MEKERALTSNALARTLMVLFGVYLLVEGFVAAGNALSGLGLNLGVAEGSVSSIFSTVGGMLAAILLPVVLLHGLPGLLLVVRGPDWADRLVPPDPDETPAELEFVVLLSVGLMLIGTWFVIGGVGGVVGGLALVWQTDALVRGMAWQPIGSAVASLAGGGVAIGLGRRMLARRRG